MNTANVVGLVPVPLEIKEPTMKPWPLAPFKGLPKHLLVILFVLTVGVSPLYAESQRTMVNLRGDQVTVPNEVPSREHFVFKRLVNVNGQLIAFLYSDPRFRRPADYAETYNLSGELLEIAWYKPAAGVKRARDINLGKPNAKRPARILNIPQKRREDDQRPASAEGNGRLPLQDRY